MSSRNYTVAVIPRQLTLCRKEYEVRARRNQMGMRWDFFVCFLSGLSLFGILQTLSCRVEALAVLEQQMLP